MRNISEIITEQSGAILRVQLNRPTWENAMTSAKYVTLAELPDSAAKDDEIRVAVRHGAGDSFCADNDIGDFLKSPPTASESPQSALIQAPINLEKPIVAAVHVAAIGGGTTMSISPWFRHLERATRESGFNQNKRSKSSH